MSKKLAKKMKSIFLFPKILLAKEKSSKRMNTVSNSHFRIPEISMKTFQTVDSMEVTTKATPTRKCQSLIER